jgi:biotin transport system substrate-specific component
MSVTNPSITAIRKNLLIHDLPVPGRLLWAGSFAVLTAVSAQFEIPLQPVPFTLQTFFVLLAGGLLGPAAGATSMVFYLLSGLLGLPVFAGFGSGLVKMMGPTGGYLLSFPLAAALTGWIAGEKTSTVRILAAMTAGLTVIFVIGVVHLNAVLLRNWEESLRAGFLIFSWWDALKVVAAAAVVRAVRGQSGAS